MAAILITVAGQLDRRWVQWFEGMTLTHGETGFGATDLDPTGGTYCKYQVGAIGILAMAPT